MKMRFFLLTFLITFNSGVFAQTKEDITEIQLRIKQLESLYSDGVAVGYPEFRQIQFTHLFESKNADAIAIFSIEGLHGGNGNSLYLAIFASVERGSWPKRKLNRYRLIGIERVGGKWWRILDWKSLRVEKSRLHFNGKRWLDNDAGCCPSQEFTTSFEITENGIREEQ